MKLSIEIDTGEFNPDRDRLLAPLKIIAGHLQMYEGFPEGRDVEFFVVFLSDTEATVSFQWEEPPYVGTTRSVRW